MWSHVKIGRIVVFWVGFVPNVDVQSSMGDISVSGAPTIDPINYLGKVADGPAYAVNDFTTNTPPQRTVYLRAGSDGATLMFKPIGQYTKDNIYGAGGAYLCKA